MPDILIYNTLNGRAVSFQRSVNESIYAGRNDVLESPDLTALAAVPFTWWIVDAGLVREMTQVEKDALAAEQLAAQLAAEDDAINQARIADLETKSGTAVLNADKLTAIL